MELDIDYYKKVAQLVFNTHSPSGYTEECIKVVAELLEELDYSPKIDNKGNLSLLVKGISNEKLIATSAHIDTLGLMVRAIKGNGKLTATMIGSVNVATLDSEYCIIRTRDGRNYSGTIVCTSASVHVAKDAATKERNLANIEIRIDEKVHSKDDVLNLGIQNGDFVFIEPKLTFTESGFLKSRFIDDKASVCLLVSLLKDIKDNKIKLKYDTLFYFTVYEEVGHGASMLDKAIDEFVTIDMGCIGEDLAGSEYAVSISAKDSTGPYDYQLTTKLIELSKKNNLNYVIDIFPSYGSDVGAARTAGGNFKGALIGQGVDASHGMERVHFDGIKNTYKLIYAYLKY